MLILGASLRISLAFGAGRYACTKKEVRLFAGA
jgi:hypothetical protein